MPGNCFVDVDEDSAIENERESSKAYRNKNINALIFTGFIQSLSSQLARILLRLCEDRDIEIERDIDFSVYPLYMI